jgi:large subunit ribosomal protein L3
MGSVYAKDDTADSMTKGKRIVVPATIIECPNMKIFSVRFYNKGKVAGEVVVSNDKELKRIVKVPKAAKKIEDFKGEYDDARIIVYSEVIKTDIKKTPDLIEIAFAGKKEDKMNFIKDKVGKTISISEVFQGGIVDVRGVTTGLGLNGPVKKMGISLKSHKSEKGVRRPGNLAPWSPSRLTLATPLAGQLGYFTRVIYNNMILKIGKISEKDINRAGGFKHYGNIHTDYILVKGSVTGPQKRPLLITYPVRPTKKTAKQKLEFIELR